MGGGLVGSFRVSETEGKNTHEAFRPVGTESHGGMAVSVVSRSIAICNLRRRGPASLAIIWRACRMKRFAFCGSAARPI